MTAFCRDLLLLLGNEAKMMECWCIVQCWSVSFFSKQVSWISGCCKNFAHHHIAWDPQHLSISLTADSAIAGGVLGTDTPRLWQCDVGRRGKQSTWQTAVCDECCCTARLFSTEMRPHHTAAPGPSLVTHATADRIQACCACLPLLAWYGFAIPCTRTARGADMDSQRRLRSASTFELNIPPTRRVTVGDRAFGVAAARVWSSLPSDVTASTLLSIFKRRLKTSLFSRSFDLWLNCVTLLLLIFFAVKCSRSFLDCMAL